MIAAFQQGLVGALLLCAALFFMACGPIRPPRDAYQDAGTLLTQMKEKRGQIRSFRISGSIDHVQKQRIRGKVYIFAQLPHHLRIDVLSPFGNTLSVLTADKAHFGLSDYKVGRFFSGEPSPCNVERFVGIALPPEDVIAILIGQVPLIEGTPKIAWDPDGHYVVTVANGDMIQTLHIGADKTTLPLLRAQMTDGKTTIFDVTFESWRKNGTVSVPYEIFIKMPRDDAELLVQYETDGVELNVDLPADAWQQTVPGGTTPEQLICN